MTSTIFCSIGNILNNHLHVPSLTNQQKDSTGTKFYFKFWIVYYITKVQLLIITIINY